MKPQIGIREEDLQAVALGLNKLLADEFLLYTKTRHAHWNLEGPDFYAKHKLFEEQYEQLEEITDNVAERIRSLGHYAAGSLKQFLSLSHLTEEIREKNDSDGLIKALLLDHEGIIMSLRGEVGRFAKELNDIGTSDFITNIMETHEKMAWILRAHLCEPHQLSIL